MTRRAIVTGGNSGIGRYSAYALADAGHDVGITYNSDRDGAEETATEVRKRGVHCEIEQMNLSDIANGPKAIDALVARLGGLDVFVNNAGQNTATEFLSYPLEDAIKEMNVNAIGAFAVIQRAADYMLGLGGKTGQGISPKDLKVKRRETPGRILVVTSVHEVVPAPGSIVYCMSKHALGGMVKVLALELGHYNITINAIAPGEIATKMNKMDAEEAYDQPREAIPARRAGHPKEVAAVVRFLASDEASFVNGTRYVVDGGFETITPFAFEQYRDVMDKF